MKVGTDAVLLGAWTDVSGARRILDVGTGSGLLALMMAQRTTAHIDALEIDAAGAAQAAGNAMASPWSDRIRVVHADARAWTEGPYDLLISNPPFFRRSLKAPDALRNQARHDDTLPWEDLAALAARLLSLDGRFSLILPIEADGRFEALCWSHRLYLSRRWTVSSLPDRSPNRLLLTFQRRQALIDHGHLVLQSAPGRRSPEFAALTADFYR